jgi:hypothetical protein
MRARERERERERERRMREGEGALLIVKNAELIDAIALACRVCAREGASERQMRNQNGTHKFVRVHHRHT